MITNATATSVWDGGITITVKCKVNMETKEVFDPEIVDINGLDILEKEYVTIDGVDYPISGDKEEAEYWYR